MNEKSITTITLKKINKKSVYQYIYEHRQTAKQQIVQDLTMGLSMHSGTLEHICIDPEGPECYCGQKGCLVVGTHGQYTPAIGAALLFIEEFLQSEF